MSSPIFYEKSFMDLNNESIVLTVTDAVASDTGSASLDAIRNRNNASGWGTTESTDAANTQIDVDFGDIVEIDTLLLILHNFKAYTIQYDLDSAGFTDFSTVINVSGNTENVTKHEFVPVELDTIRLIITGAMTVDADKFLRQMIATNKIGQPLTQMKITNVQQSQNKNTIRTLSGKHRVSRSVGGFEFTMSKNNFSHMEDIRIFQNMYSLQSGFLVWLNGDDTDQFRVPNVQGYRREDIFLMIISNEYEPNWSDGRYQWGIDLRIDFVESIV